MSDRRGTITISLDRSTLRRGLMIGIIAALIAVPTYLIAAVNWPASYPFQSGTTISSSAINDSFAAVESAIKVVNVTHRENATRVDLPTNASSMVIESFTVDKRSPTSTLIVEGSLSGFADASGAMNQGWQYGAGPEKIAHSVMYEATATTSRIYPTRVVLTGHTTTGPQQLVLRYFAQDGTVGGRPFRVYNPNGSDDARLGQTSSSYTIWEVEGVEVP